MGGTCVGRLCLHHPDGIGAWGFYVVFGVGRFCVKVDVLQYVVALPFVGPGKLGGLADALLQQGW
jgi:hypothetical protein